MADATTKTIMDCIEQDKPFYVLRAMFDAYYGKEKIEYICKTKKEAKNLIKEFESSPELYSDVSISEYKISFQERMNFALKQTNVGK